MPTQRLLMKAAGVASVATISLFLGLAAASAEPYSSGANRTGTAKGVYTIGAASDLTGPNAATYAGKLQGFQLYVNWLNSSGGINGHKIKLLVRDHKSDVALATAALRNFTENKATAMFFGGLSSTMTTTLLNTTGTMPSLYVSNCYPPLAPAEGGSIAPNVFCVGASAMTEEVAAFPRAIEKITGGKNIKVAVVTPDIAGCVFLAKVFVEAFQKRGWQTLPTETVPFAQTDMEPTARKLASEGANVVVQYCTVSHMVNLAQAFGRVNWNGKYFYGVAHEGTVQGLATAKSPDNYVLYYFSLPSSNLPVWKVIRTAYKKYRPSNPVEDMAWGWATGITLKTALEKCGFPCSNSKLNGIMNHLVVDDPQFVQLWGGPLKWTPTSHSSTAKKRYYIAQWNPTKKRVEIIKTAVTVWPIRFPKS